MARADNSFWTDAQNQYGVFHHADRKSPKYVSGVLVVFVHGLMGDRIATWRDMPARVLNQLEMDVDVFSFSYPTSLLQRADIETAAQDMGFVLTNTFQSYHHYVFVTHSAGGLVVKRMLCSAADDLIENMNREPQGLALVALKARNVVNITVPHLGGAARLTKIGMGAYKAFYAVFKPISSLANAITFGSLGWGQNKIIGQIRHESPFLKDLDNHFHKRLGQCDDYALPRPTSEDIFARGDIAVDPLGHGSAIVARGTHGSVKTVTDSQHQLVLSVVCKAVGSFKCQTDFAVARLTLERCMSIDRDLKVVGLMQGSAALGDIPGVKAGGQADALNWVSEWSRSTEDNDNRKVLTGHAGVGKSSVLRRAAIQLCNDVFRGDPTEAELPIFVPMHQLTLKLSESERSDLTGKDLWARIAGYWCNFASRLQEDEGGLDEPIIDFEWLDDRMSRKPTAVILDAVDEFLNAHPYIGLDMIGEMIAYLEKEYAANPRLIFVVSIRSIYSHESLFRLALSTRNIFEIAHLTPEQAEAQFPGALRLMDKVHDPGLRTFLLTPLILSQLAGQNAVDGADFKSRNEIIRAALESLIERGGLTDIAPTSRWLDVLGVLSWIFLSTYRAEIPLQDLGASARDLAAKWEEYFANNPKAGARDILYALRILGNEEWLNVAIRRTIFVQTTQDQIRFVHREWQDHLLGKYLANSIMSRNYGQLAGRAYYYQAYRSASEYMRGFVITEDFLEGAVTASKSLGAFVLGNTFTMLTYSWVGAETNALRYAISAIADMNELVRFATLVGLSFRTLYNDPNDALHPTLARQLPEALKSYWREGGLSKNKCVRSAAWCYQKAVSNKIGIVAPDEPWCALGSAEEDFESALNFVAYKHEGTWILLPENRSTQVAFLALVQLGQIEIHPRLVSTMHYLYPLVVAYAAGVSAHVVDEELRSVLTPGSALGKAVQEFEPVPELGLIWEACLEIYWGRSLPDRKQD